MVAAPGLQPALCLHNPRGSFHQAPGRQRSSIAAGPLRAHSPLLLGHSSLPFARLQIPNSLKTPKTLQFLRSSCHPALWPSAFAAPGLQPAFCLHIARGSFHQAPGCQRSSIAACPLPAHSILLLGHSSLPFARLQTPKTLKTPKTPETPKTLQFPCGSCHQALWPSAFAAPGLQPALPVLFRSSGPGPGKRFRSVPGFCFRSSSGPSSGRFRSLCFPVLSGHCLLLWSLFAALCLLHGCLFATGASVLRLSLCTQMPERFSVHAAILCSSRASMTGRRATTDVSSASVPSPKTLQAEKKIRAIFSLSFLRGFRTTQEVPGTANSDFF